MDARDADTIDIAPAQTGADEAVEYSLSNGMVARLANLDVSIAFSSYQSGILYFLGRGREGAHLHQSALAKPMGICVDGPGRLALASGAHVVRFQNLLALHERINDSFDACYVPRTFHLTGELDLHDIGVDRDDRPIFVNTRFNCLATLSPKHSFAPIWKPPFITGLLDGDKCHLNGLAMLKGKPAYVTAVSRSDVIDGWRDRRADGGVVVDVEANKIVCEGLSMPHSPRMHRGELWLLNSGTGELGVVERLSEGKGRFAPRAFCSGFRRGLAFRDKYAFVGLSKPRYKRFEGLGLDDRLRQTDAEPCCGVQIIDLDAGGCVDWLRIDGAVPELDDVAVIPGVKRPMALTPFSGEAAALITVEAV
ncbi:MAG TPA: TIGR03032 family protein [Roseiarcus sp.]